MPQRTDPTGVTLRRRPRNRWSRTLPTVAVSASALGWSLS